jgi:predicted nucleic acid-binding protein
VLYYFDTSIWLDHYLKREKNGEVALELILKIIRNDDKILFSNFVEKEMKNLGLSQNEIHSLLRIVKPDHIKKVQVRKDQFTEAVRLAKQRSVPLGDAIHAIIARDHEAQLVSRDWDFEKLKDITKARIPEDLLDT